MTREEAIKLVKEVTGMSLDWDDAHYEALQMAIGALEAEPCEDVMAIHTQGLDEGIRCAMCTNSMKSDRGCDGGCVVNEAMYKEVMNTIRNHIVPPVAPARKKGKWKEYPHEWGDNWQYSDYECSICHDRAHFDTDFCPNCGADMRGNEE